MLCRVKGTAKVFEMRMILAVLASFALAVVAHAAEEAHATQGTSDAKSRQEAMRSIPWDKLDADQKAKAKAVLDNVSVFRRLPMRAIDCDPDLYLFLVRHPDVIVNIWETLKLTQLSVKQIGPQKFRAVESDGTTITFEYLYRTHDTHVVYAEGVYTGPVLGREVKGSGLVILKSGYVRETDGRYYVTSRMDTFLNVEAGAVELVAKTIMPLAGKVADNNFTQSVAFLGSLSRTAEVNPSGVHRLASKLTVKPEVRIELMELTDTVAKRAEGLPALRREEAILTAGRPLKPERR